MRVSHSTIIQHDGSFSIHSERLFPWSVSDLSDVVVWPLGVRKPVWPKGLAALLQLLRKSSDVFHKIVNFHQCKNCCQSQYSPSATKGDEGQTVSTDIIINLCNFTHSGIFSYKKTAFGVKIIESQVLIVDIKGFLDGSLCRPVLQFNWRKLLSRLCRCKPGSYQTWQVRCIFSCANREALLAGRATVCKRGKVG